MPRLFRRNRIFPRACCSIGRAVVLLTLFGLLAGSNRGFGGETSLNEYQVKSLFLLHFAKYVDWPADAFEAANAPIVIGVVGEGKFGGELAKTVEGKNVDGRPILIRQIQTPEELDKCHILFIRASEKMGLAEILGRLKTRPVLTVGEADHFLEQGGVINFVKKEGKVRLEINLDAARQANLQISSKLLNVADVVKGKLK
ncbi:MAG: hypothetical protein QOJ40_1821 [Verrucomicrobiota bacterium]